MVAFYIIVGVVFIAGGILGFLFYMLRKESVQPVSVEPMIPVVQVNQPPDVQKRVVELEEELRAISDKAVSQAQEAMTMVDTLTKANEKLKTEAEQGHAVYKTQMAELEQSLDRLRQDNSTLQGQLDGGQAKVRELQDEIIAVRKHLGDELLTANAQIVELKAAPKVPVPAEEIEKLNKEIEEIRRESENLRHEVTKNRAQASGFERMCDNYKVQLDDALGRAQAMEGDHAQLQAAKDRLEAALADAHKQNEELTKREKLCQFELEKSRSQFVALEKSYEEAKLKVQGPLPDGQPEAS